MLKGKKGREVPSSFPSKEVFVWLEEEYGYRVWLWFTEMSVPKFTEFWEGLETVKPYFFDITKLPGELWPFGEAQLAIDSKGEEIVGDLRSISAVKYDARGNPMVTTTYALHPQQAADQNLWTLPNFWRGHIHMDDDSGVSCVASKTSLKHKGYKKTDFVTGASD